MPDLVGNPEDWFSHNDRKKLNKATSIQRYAGEVEHEVNTRVAEIFKEDMKAFP